MHWLRRWLAWLRRPRLEIIAGPPVKPRRKGTSGYLRTRRPGRR